MKPEERLHVCLLLAEAQAMLDADASSVAAIYVTQAMEALGCAVSDPQGSQEPEAAPKPSTRRGSSHAPSASTRAS